MFANLLIVEGCSIVLKRLPKGQMNPGVVTVLFEEEVTVEIQ